MVRRSRDAAEKRVADSKSITEKDGAKAEAKVNLVVNISISKSQMQEVELKEKDAQGDYEQFTGDAAEKRVADSKSITEEDGAKAEAKVNLVVNINIGNSQMQEVELEEKDAQGDYEQFTIDAADQRVADSKSITEKEGAKAEAEMNIVKETKDGAEAEVILVKETGYGKPVDLCVKSRRWRDARGRFCRPPSPAAHQCDMHF